MNSLRRTLTVSLTAMLVVIFSALWLLLSVAITRVAQDQLLMHLEHDGDAVIAAVSRAADGALRINQDMVEDVYRQPQSGHYFLVRAEPGPLIRSPSLGDTLLEVPALSPGARASRSIDGPAGQSILMLTRGVVVAGQAVQVAVGEDLSEMDREVRDQSRLVLLVILPLFIAAVLLQRFMIGRALRPLDEVRHALEQIGRREVDRIETEAPAEVRPLVDEVNRLLVLVNRRLLQARTAIGNLAHALKTPLAVLYRVADEPTLPDGMKAQLRDQTRIIRERLERELVRARLAGGENVGGIFNPRTELEVMRRILQSIHRDKDLEIGIDAPDRNLTYDREDLLELLGNLTDNACKWARQRVHVEVAERPGEKITRIRVADDGPGCSAEDFERLAARGVRLDESKDGHGLGLSICKEITEFYGGSITFANDPELGGLAVTVELPLSA